MAVGDAVGEEAAGVVGRAGGRNSRLFLALVRRVIRAGQSHLFHTGSGPGPGPGGLGGLESSLDLRLGRCCARSLCLQHHHGQSRSGLLFGTRRNGKVAKWDRG